MARIPVGNFGLATPERAPAPGVALGAFVNPAGGIAAEGAQSYAMSQARVDASQAQEAAAQQEEQRRVTAQALKEARNVAAIRVREETENELADTTKAVLSDVLTGKTKGEEARLLWQERSREVLDRKLQDADPTMHEGIRTALVAPLGRFDRALQEGVLKRAQSDIGANINATLEEAQRAALRDPEAAIARAGMLLDARGADAGLDPLRIQQEKQKFAERVRYTQAYTLVNDAPDNVAALRGVQKQLAGDVFNDIDPQQRAVLSGHVRSRIEIVERRGAVQAEANARALDREFTAFRDFMDKGVSPSAEYAALSAANFKGTRYGPLVSEMIQAQPEGAGFAAMPVAQQAQTLQNMLAERNTKGADPAQVARYERLERVHKGALADVKADPWRAAQERGVIVAPAALPRDLTLITAPGSALAERVKQADVVATWAGRAVSPLQPEEARTVVAFLDSLAAPRKAEALGALAKGVGDPAKVQAMAEQFGDKSSTLATAAFLAARDLRSPKGQPVAELYLRGEEALREKRVPMTEGGEKYARIKIADTLEGVYATQQARDAALDVTWKVYAQMKANGQDSVERAIAVATGGITKWNGQKLPMPYGWSPSQFEDSVRSVGAVDLQRFANADQVVVGGRPMPVAELAAQFPRAQLRSYGERAYSVQVGAQPVLRLDGRPLVVFLKPAP
jgi:hypothetical protein